MRPHVGNSPSLINNVFGCHQFPPYTSFVNSVELEEFMQGRRLNIQATVRERESHNLKHPR